MSIQFNDTTNKRGLVQMYEKEIGANYGDVSGNSEKLAEFTARVNNALDTYLLLAAKAAGTQQSDDMNFEDYSIFTMPIVSGQRDYAYTNDVDGNRITDVQQVLILRSATATDYELIYPVDELKYPLSDILLNTNTGTPFQYGKMANGIFLDPIPSYSVSAGIKLIGNREGSYFTTADTTKKPGVPVYHEYFYLKPAYEEARIKRLATFGDLEKAVLDLEGSERLRVTGLIQEHFASRERDVTKILTNKKINYI